MVMASLALDPEVMERELVRVKGNAKSRRVREPTGPSIKRSHSEEDQFRISSSAHLPESDGHHRIDAERNPRSDNPQSPL